MAKIIFVVESLGLGGSKQAAVNLSAFLRENTDFETATFAMRSGIVFNDYLDKFDEVVVGDQVEEKLPKNFNPITDVSDETAKKYRNFSRQGDVALIVAVGGYASIFVNQNTEANLATPVVTWLHNNPQLYMNHNYAHMYSDLRKALENSTHLVVLTPEYATDFSVYNQNTTAIPNIINFKSTASSFDLITHKKQLFDQSNNRVITFIGRGNAFYEKGVDLLGEILLELDGLLNDTEYKVVINLLGAEVTDVQKHSPRELHLQNITFGTQGTVSQERVFEQLNDSFLMLATSRQEGLPNSIIEALEIATPVVSYANTGAAAILSDENLIGIGQYEDMTRRLIQLLTSRSDYFAEVESSFIDGSKYLPKAKIGEQWIRLFEQLKPDTLDI